MARVADTAALLRSPDSIGRCAVWLANATPRIVHIAVNGRETKAQQLIVKSVAQAKLADKTEEEKVEELSAATANRTQRMHTTDQERQSQRTNSERRTDQVSHAQGVSDSRAATQARGASEAHGNSMAQSRDVLNSSQSAHGSGWANSHQRASSSDVGSSMHHNQSNFFDNQDSTETSRGHHDASRDAKLDAQQHANSSANSHSHNTSGGVSTPWGGGNASHGQAHAEERSNMDGHTHAEDHERSNAGESSDAAFKKRAGGSSSGGGNSQYARNSVMDAGSASGNQFGSQAQTNRLATSDAQTRSDSRSMHEATGMQQAHSSQSSFARGQDIATGSSSAVASRDLHAMGADESQMKQGATATKVAGVIDRSTELTLNSDVHNKFRDFDPALDVICKTKVEPGRSEPVVPLWASQVRHSNLYLHFAVEEPQPDGTILLDWQHICLPTDQVTRLILKDTNTLVYAESPERQWTEGGRNHLLRGAVALLDVPTLVASGEWLEVVLKPLYLEDPKLACYALANVMDACSRPENGRKAGAFLDILRQVQEPCVSELAQMTFELERSAPPLERQKLRLLREVAAKNNKRFEAVCEGITNNAIKQREQQQLRLKSLALVDACCASTGITQITGHTVRH